MSDVETRDFHRRYVETYIRMGSAKDPRDLEVVYCRSMRHEDGNLRVYMASEKRPEFAIDFPGNQKLNFEFPNIGTFQLGITSAVFQRNPQRQWRRGICDRTAQVSNHTFGITQTSLSFQTLDAAFKGEQFTFPQAMEMLNSGKYQSVAIDGNWALAASPYFKDKYIMFYMETSVGSITRGGKIDRLFDPLFQNHFEEFTSAYNS